MGWTSQGRQVDPQRCGVLVRQQLRQTASRRLGRADGATVPQEGHNAFRGGDTGAILEYAAGDDTRLLANPDNPGADPHLAADRRVGGDVGVIGNGRGLTEMFDNHRGACSSIHVARRFMGQASPPQRP